MHNQKLQAQWMIQNSCNENQKELISLSDKLRQNYVLSQSYRLKIVLHQ